MDSSSAACVCATLSITRQVACLLVFLVIIKNVYSLEEPHIIAQRIFIPFHIFQASSQSKPTLVCHCETKSTYNDIKYATE